MQVNRIGLQYTLFTYQQQFLHFFFMKSSSNSKLNDSFGICSWWRFQNTAYMLNLMKFWLRYFRLKTIDIFQKLISFSSFSLPNISVNSSSNSKIRDRFEICLSWGFWNCHWLFKLNWLRYSRLMVRNNFQKINE